jgi:hypothetical protein
MNHVRKAKKKFGRHVSKDVQDTPSNPCIRWFMSNERVEKNMEKKKKIPLTQQPSTHTHTHTHSHVLNKNPLAAEKEKHFKRKQVRTIAKL